jgi:hypothetical protein
LFDFVFSLGLQGFDMFWRLHKRATCTDIERKLTSAIRCKQATSVSSASEIPDPQPEIARLGIIRTTRLNSWFVAAASSARCSCPDACQDDWTSHFAESRDHIGLAGWNCCLSMSRDCGNSALVWCVQWRGMVHSSCVAMPTFEVSARYDTARGRPDPFETMEFHGGPVGQRGSEHGLRRAGEKVHPVPNPRKLLFGTQPLNILKLQPWDPKTYFGHPTHGTSL